jgi:Short C-terminal domain
MIVPCLLVEQLARTSRVAGRLINLVKRASMTERSRRERGAAKWTAGNEHAVALDSRPDPLSLCNMHLALEASGLGMRGWQAESPGSPVSGGSPASIVRAVFGDNARLEKKLRKSGAHATAEVLSAEQSRLAVTRGAEGIVANTRLVWKLRLRVQPEGEPEFEVAIKEGWDQLSRPIVGMQVPVLYDPKDHGKVVVDRSGDWMAAMIGGDAADMLRSGRAEKLARVKDIVRDAQAHPDRPKQTFHLGPDTVGTAGPDSGGTAGGLAEAFGAAASQQAPDPVDQLAKLADLRDRGIVSDAEFETQKRRILGESD